MEEPALRLREDGLEWRELEGEVVALDLQQSEYFGINKSGSVLWQAVSRGATRRELIDLLVQRYGLDEEAAGAHVDEFVSALARHGVLDTP